MSKPIILQRRIRRFFCTFAPFLVRKQKGSAANPYWNDHSTDSFIEMDEASQVMLDELMSLADKKDTRFLDMGCNIGRHLNYLYQQGFKSLTGIDFSSTAIEAMKKKFSDMHNNSDVKVASFQDYLNDNDNVFDIVYTRGATFELVHPSYPLVRKVCSIAKKYVVLVVNEAGHSYPRFWEYEFASNGWELMHMRRPASMKTPDHIVTMLVFRKIN